MAIVVPIAVRQWDEPPCPSTMTAVNVALRERVQDDLLRRFSPEQITGRLRRKFPDDPEMWV